MLIHKLRHHWGLLILLSFFCVSVGLSQVVFPVMEGSDEPLHISYALRLRNGFGLPDRTTYLTNDTRQSSGQPPFAYAVGALALDMFNAPRLEGQDILNHLETVRNRWYLPHLPWERADNHNIYLHGNSLDLSQRETAFGDAEIVAVTQTLRITSLFWGLFGLVGAYGAGYQLFKKRSWAWLSAAVYGFIPTLIFTSTYFTNDAPAIAFSAWLTWMSLRALSQSLSWRSWAGIGILLALAGLSKINTLIFLPVIALVWLLRPQTAQQRVISVLSVGIPFVFLFGAWAWQGWVHYQDPIGIATHQYQDTMIYSENLRSFSQLVEQLPHLYLSYFAWMATVPLHPLTYTVFGLLIILALLGWLIPAKTRQKHQSWVQKHGAMLILVSVCGLAFIAMIRWMLQLNFTGGRLMYPAHVAVCLLIVWGWHRLVRRFSSMRALRFISAGFFIISGVLIAPIALQDAYAGRTLNGLPNLTPINLNYGGVIRLLGIAQTDRRITQNWHALSLCWEVLQAPHRNTAFSVKFVRDGVIVADRTSIFGMGRFPSALWQVGDQFCDEVHVPNDDPDVMDDPLLEPATIYDVLVVVLDADTSAVDFPATTLDDLPVETPIVAQVISPANDMRTADSHWGGIHGVNFANFAQLEGYAIQGDLQAGNTITLNLLWHVIGTTPDSWAQFIHLAGNGESISLLDGDPRQGRYPTWAWNRGEWIADTWTFTLPQEIPAGEYQILTGFYRRDTGERMPITLNGVNVPDRTLPMMVLTLPEP